MKLTKRILCLMLVMALAFALCACGEKKEDKKDAPKDNGGTTTPSASETIPSIATTTNWADNLDDSHFNDGELVWD